MNKYKPTGWKYESHRHSLASKGIKTGQKKAWSIVALDNLWRCDKCGRFMSGKQYKNHEGFCSACNREFSEFDYAKMSEKESKRIAKEIEQDELRENKNIYEEEFYKARGMKRNLMGKWDYAKLSVDELNKKAPSLDGMEPSGSELYTPNLDNFDKEFKEEFRQGYAQSYKIEPTDSGVNHYRVIWYRKKSPYSFYWTRGKEKVLKNSSGNTADKAVVEFRKRPLKPISTYPVSSVEQNMFLSYVKESIDISKPKDAKALMSKAQKMVDMTPYTNWSGD